MGKLSRRAMLGTAVGGALAAPDVARTAMNEGAKMLGGLQAAVRVAPGYYGGETAKSVAEQNWTLQMLAQAKRIASGDIRDEDRNYPTEGNPAPYRALKSVSEDARQFMRTSYYERQWRERSIKAALDALDHYDKTGILRNFF